MKISDNENTGMIKLIYVLWFCVLICCRLQSHFFLAILALPQFVVTQHHSECSVRTHGNINQETVYAAPARFVPVPPVDPGLQAEFYRLFTTQDNYTKVTVRQEPLPPGISQNDLDFIASVCPKTAFFYSMSPQHVIARDLLQRYLTVQPSPREVLRVAKVILHNHEINPKIWYYALMGAVMERPDMSGLVLAQPLDAIPDLFVPAPVLSEALSRYRPVFGIGHTILNYPAGGGGVGGGHAVGTGPGGNGGGFVPSLGPVRPAPRLRGTAGIAGLAPLSDLESGSYQSFTGPLTSASYVNEHRIGLAEGRAMGQNYTDGTAEATNEVGFAKRRGMIIRKRVKVKNRRQRHESVKDRQVGPKVLTKTLQHYLEDNAGAESIATGQAVSIALPPPSTSESLLQRNGAGVRRNMNVVVKDDDSQFSNVSYARGQSNYRRQSPEENYYGVKLSYGEEDDEYEELMRIHETSSNSTRDIRQRILRRRQRRKKTEKERPSSKVKRQAFGPPVFQQPFQGGIHDCIVINATIGAINGEENKLWYFREDLMANQHHWYWHQMYPVNATRHGDRRAELFFFVHRNLVARYNAERLSNGMPRTLEFIVRHGSVIEEGYHANLVDMNSGKYWTPREPHVALTDILHEQDRDFARNIFLKDVHDLYHKFIYSIKDGHLVGPNLEPIPIQNVQGIDHLANAVEATDISVNPIYYHSIGVHNLGHQVLGLAQDPQFVAQLPTGVMADTAVTMRDPVFYTFHSGIDNLFDRHKRALPPYQLYDGEFPLVWPGVAISNVEVVSSFQGGPANHLRTFFSSDRFPLESGIDGSIHNGQLRQDVCAVHLNHEPFTYKITVNVNPCVHTVSGQGMIRVFMAPRFDEFGHRFPLKVQRRLMFQLDVFPVQLQQGRNLIIRRSVDSSLTKPWPANLRQQAFGGGAAAGAAAGRPPGAADFCGCGWPQHLLIPKGSPHGMPFDLFVMITNYDQDIVQNLPEDLHIPEGCTSPYIFCGIPFRRYPDARPMGYPFDRLPYKLPGRMLHPHLYRTVESLEEYVHSVPNMATRVVVIQHTETLVT